MLAILSSLALYYHFLTGKDIVDAFFISLATFVYWDLIFLLAKRDLLTYGPFAERNILLLGFSVFFISLNNRIKKKTLNIDLRVALPLLILSAPILYLVIQDFVNLPVEGWYLVQYGNLGYTLEDIVLKAAPILSLTFSSKTILKRINQSQGRKAVEEGIKGKIIKIVGKDAKDPESQVQA